MLRRRLCAALVAGLCAAVAPAAVAPDSPIAELEVRADGPVNASQVLEILGLEAGKAVDPVRLREGVRVLFAGGEVDYVRVLSEPGEEGPLIAVELSLRPRVEAVEVVGPGLRWRLRVRPWLQVHDGDLFSLAAVERSANRVRRELRERGRADAEVETAIDYRRSDNTVTVVFDVSLGEPRRVERVRLEGMASPPDEVAEAARLKPGSVLTDGALERLRRRVEAGLRRAGFWEAEVTGVEILADGGLGEVVLHVEPGHRFELELTAPEELREIAEEALPDPAEEGIHPAQTGVLADGVREALQRRGYLLAQVEVVLESGEGEVRTLMVEIDPGRRRRVTSVEFPGAAHVDLKSLRRAVGVRPGRLGGWRGQVVTEATLEADRQAVEGLYLQQGWADVVAGAFRLEVEGEDGVRVLFPITEGERWILTDLRLEGFPVEALVAVEGERLALAENGPWDGRRVEDTRRRLLAALTDAGYPDGTVTATVDTSVPCRATVVMRASAGEYVEIGEIVIVGLQTTRPSVVRGALERAGVRTGAPYSSASLREARSRLYELAIFSRVDLNPIPGQEELLRRGLVVRLEKGLQRSYLLGVGWDTDSKFRLTVGWSHLNLWGGAHAASAEVRLSGREQRFQASLREAHVPWLDVPGFVVAYKTEEDFASYSQRRHGLWFEVGDHRRRPYRWWLRYEYQIIRPDAPLDILSELEREEQESRVSSLAPTLEWDSRDDPFLPSRGALASTSVEWAFPIFSANARFLRLFSSFSLYGPLAGGTGALGVRMGAIRPIATGGDEPGNLKVPIGVRYFAGGSASHRAFALDRLGVPGQTLAENGDPIGGNALLVLNLEYRRAVRGALSGVVFVDAGNVWAEPALVDLGDVRWGLGLGLRYDTPAGPLRLEYGVKLDRKPGESSGELFVSFGTAF